VLEAGAELLVVSSLPQQADAYDAVAAESREIPRSRIKKSVGRLLTVKVRNHLGGAGRH
jgi:beta-glucosidase-like glycosyl hydrolase